jgi:putative membrane protein
MLIERTLYINRTVLKFALGAIFTLGLGAGHALAQTAAESGAAALPTAQFVQALASMDAFEQRAGKVAQVMGSSLEVRKFSRTMADDHAKSAMALIDAVSRAQVPVPTSDLAATQAGTVKDLYSVSSKDFDRTYMTGEVASHQEALETAQAYAAGGDNAAVKAIAAGLIPGIQRHLDTARIILGHVR